MLLKAFRNHQVRKSFAALVITTMGVELLSPARAFALTSGPSQPEFSSFEPVATTQMVNEYTGDFTYNIPVIEIPGPDGAGYALSLSYHSGASPEEESSWVGYGWTLNPGAINRGKRGIADDVKAGQVTRYNKVTPSQTVSMGGYVGDPELFGVEFLSANVSATLSKNNYTGLSTTYGAGVSVSTQRGRFSLGYSLSNGEGSFSLSYNPTGKLNEKKEDVEVVQQATGHTTQVLPNPPKDGNKSKPKIVKMTPGAWRGFSMSLGDFYMRTMPTVFTPYSGFALNYTFAPTAQATPLPLGVQFGVTGAYTLQENKAKDEMSTYGFMYSEHASQDPGNVMDYYTERDNPYTKQDRYLGIPYSNYDSYVITAEGIGGGFRAHRESVGHYRPNSVTSGYPIANVENQVHFGTNIGVGTSVGVGANVMTVRGWGDGGYVFSGRKGASPDKFFRFFNDPGGRVEAGDFTIPSSSTPAALTTTISGVYSLLNNGEPVKSSSYIAYHTNAEMMESSLPSGPSDHYKAYTRIPELLDNSNFVDRTSIPDGIGEYAIFQPNGVQYVFGLPVYARNEGSFAYDVRGLNASAIQNNSQVFGARTPESAASVVGQMDATPYASTFLLTEIHGPDYLDRDNDGPDDQDFGSWTKFSYTRALGTADKTAQSSSTIPNWYKWRSPYTGMEYTKGSFSTPMDDVGSVMYGEKEVYYLQKIETRTHYALFYTTDRLDGTAAILDEALATSATNGVSGVQLNTLARLKKLDKIELYSKDGNTPRLLKTVHFEYDYSAWPGIPNSVGSGSGQTGKLTLKKLWVEFEGVKNARIRPYEFQYQYPAATNYPAPYAALAVNTAGLNQTPAYSKFDTDAWGNYQANGGLRNSLYQTWPDQTPITSFDPAAWQLKQILLPSGGEIHIQYEQDDYEKVQDRNVMQLAPLRPSSNDDDRLYHIDPQDLGLSPSNPQQLAEIQEIVGKMQNQFVTRKERIYFKFLYSLLSSGAPANLNDCSSEYIDGYAKVQNVSWNGFNIVVELENGSATEAGVPKKVCRNFYKTNRTGNVPVGGDCDAAFTMADAIPPGITGILALAVTQIVAGNECASVDFQNSYFRIPMSHAKLGGGIRVKRLLMYDKGIEGTSASRPDRVLYGSEYFYKNSDGSSSGVASNEPAGMRGENPLYNVLDRNDQGFLNRVVCGKDKEQLEGPIGEGILPSPAIGYGRVVIRNIHSGTTAPGFAEKSFFTWNDFPYDGNFEHLGGASGVEQTPIQRGRPDTWIWAPTILMNSVITEKSLHQGYRFIQYNIQGNPKRAATYGSIADNETQPWEIGRSVLSSEQLFEYFEPGESVPMSYGVNDIRMEAMPGRETDVAMESRSIHEYTFNGTVQQDVNVNLLLVPAFTLTVLPYADYMEAELNTHVSTKIISYPAIQKRVTAMQDGIRTTTENVGFDPASGQVLMTRTYDGYHQADLAVSQNHNGALTSLGFPASREYPAMGQRATSERYLVPSTADIAIQKFSMGGQLYLRMTGTNATAVCAAMERLTEGDMIELKVGGNGGASHGIFHIGRVNGNLVELFPSQHFNSNPNVPVTAQNMDIEIIHSGRTNQLSTQVGSLVTYGAPGSTAVVTQVPDLADRNQIASMLNTAIPNGQIDWPGCIFRESGSHDIRIQLSPVGLQTSQIVRIELLDVFNAGTANETTASQCYTDVPVSSGYTFQIDPVSGELMIVNPDNTCNPIYLDCLQFCKRGRQVKTLPRVLKASAVHLENEWPYDYATYGAPVTPANPYESGQRGKWRVAANYVYRSPIKGGNQDLTAMGAERNYADAGTFTLELFDWQRLSNNDPAKWLKSSTVERYSPHGQPLQEVDILGVRSAAKFGYDYTLPYLVAANADQNSAYFESFEKVYQSPSGIRVEDGVSITGLTVSDNAAHAGRKSLRMSANQSFIPRSFSITDQMVEKGFQLKFWLRDDTYGAAPVDVTLETSTPNLGNLSLNLPLTQVARTGQWTLVECTIPATGTWGSMLSGMQASLRIKANRTVWLDDVRYQPFDAKVMNYVYDATTLRLLAAFDDQHFGVYNQYNAEGQLVRKVIETERGFKTVQETQYHSPESDRP